MATRVDRLPYQPETSEGNENSDSMWIRDQHANSDHKNRRKEYLQKRGIRGLRQRIAHIIDGESLSLALVEGSDQNDDRYTAMSAIG